MQSDKIGRCAPNFTADAKRYVLRAIHRLNKK